MSAEAAPRYRPGDPVRVRDERPRGHVRTPRYVRGRTGRVMRVHGAFRDPSSLAHGGDGLPRRPLYEVAFRGVDLWRAYAGAPADAVHVDIYEHWLEKA